MPGRFVRFLQSLAWGVVLLAVFVAAAYLSFNLYVRRGAMTVPELAGLTAEEASRLLTDQGLRFRAAEPAGRWSSEVEEGRVLETRPRAGGFVKRGSAVEVVLSLGVRQASVPNLSGKARSAAQVTVQAEGLEMGETLEIANTAGEPGTIVGQDPPPGASVPAGTKVDLLVALDAPADAYVMPDLVYRRYEPVRGYFERSGFHLGAVKFEPYEGIADGTILRQNPLPGHPLRRRDVISLVVAASKGALP